MLQEGVGNPKIRKWIASVDDNALRLSVAALFEKRRGVEMLNRRDLKRSVTDPGVDRRA
ncbi:hypothetical protein ABIF07_000268 [Bradyrhizobium elkanii]|uniref:hypothetical protein n=1 Tax=Bradyrhizobium elkanii TaxID=29448 RepID=UPI002168E8AB|nr:hypothetical protein [Bradyrhizobium elkanii]MCS3695070.1 hypothetical protein [Bradyrhizobium elkanii]